MEHRNAPRLFVSDALPGEVRFDQRQTNYLRNVMRRSPGDPLRVFNGRDGEWLAQIASLGKKDGVANAQTQLRPQTPAPTLRYGFAPLKQARLDYMIEKATEMGAGIIEPVLTQHGQVRKINADRLHLHAVEACEQCGILNVPQIAAPVSLPDFLGAHASGSLIVADEGLAGAQHDAVSAIRAATPPITVLIGPEGGFSAAERALFSPRAVRVSLGPRVLRADTAAVALLALVEAIHPSVA